MKERIDNSILEQIKYLEITMENVEYFHVQASEVLEIAFEEITLDKEDGVYQAQRGRLVLSQSALQVKSRFAPDDDFEGMPTLKERIAPQNDICWITLGFLDGREEFSFCVPYDPAEEIRCGNPIEESNCPSMEYTVNGDMLLLFGEWSHAFQRVDNDFTNLVEGFGEFCGELRVKISDIQYVTREGERELRLSITVRNKEKRNAKFRNRSAELIFSNVTDIELTAGVELFRETEMYLAPMSDGRIYVGFYCTLDFFCTKIKCEWES